jgi:GNAT superfamily N-acetyltransferase
MYVFEFGNSAFIIKENEVIIAYLFGFLSQTTPTAYVHLIAVHKDYQNKGFGTKLYEHFIQFAISNGCEKIKAITSPGNTQSLNFHKKLGMSLIGEPNKEGIPIFKDYSGLGQDRVIFEKTIV